jgi:hypothetical protein
MKSYGSANIFAYATLPREWLVEVPNPHHVQGFQSESFLDISNTTRPQKFNRYIPSKAQFTFEARVLYNLRNTVMATQTLYHISVDIHHALKPGPRAAIPA